MDLATILTIASQFMQVAVAIAQDGRQQATAQEVAALRAATEAGIAAVEQDVGGTPAD
jgi:hypothetical protein